MKKITRLTPEQEAKLPEYRDKWMKIGLSCEPLDFEKAKHWASKAYEQAGLTPPKSFLQADSPLSGAVMATILKNGAQFGAQVGNQFWGQVRAQVRVQVGDQVRDQVWAQVWAQVGAQVRDQVWVQVRAQVRVQVGVQVGDQVWAQVGAQVYGSHDANWLAFYSYFINECRLTKSPDSLLPLINLAKYCGWWAPYENVCILQHRHSELHYDDQKRLHHPFDMAIKYRDGFGVYMWHGLRVPQRIIKDAPTIKKINTEDNSELRRVLIERMGYENYLRESGAVLVNSDQYGRLYTMPTDNDRLMVEVINGTPSPDGTDKKYVIPVPRISDLTDRPIATAHEAVAWSYSLKQEDYNIIQRT